MGHSGKGLSRSVESSSPGWYHIYEVCVYCLLFVWFVFNFCHRKTRSSRKPRRRKALSSSFVFFFSHDSRPWFDVDTIRRRQPCAHLLQMTFVVFGCGTWTTEPGARRSRPSPFPSVYWGVFEKLKYLLSGFSTL